MAPIFLAARWTGWVPRAASDDTGASGAPRGVPGEAPDLSPGIQADDAPARVVGTPPPVETPGPSVTPPDVPQSETERAEWADETRPDPELLAERADGPVDALVAEEESAAAAEARAIGGPAPEDAGGDPAMEPVYQAGGGVAEGFEAAEADLIENAQHREGPGNPIRDAPTQEAESDRVSAAYGEADEMDSTQVVRDPDEDPDTDPGIGPGLTSER